LTVFQRTVAFKRESILSNVHCQVTNKLNLDPFDTLLTEDQSGLAEDGFVGLTGS
jgi:hypothetical protein